MEAGTSSQQGAKRKRKQPKTKLIKRRCNIKLACEEETDVPMNKGDTILKIKDSSSSSEDNDHREPLDYDDKTQFFPIAEKKQQIIKGGVPSLQDVARQCLVNLPYLHEFFKGIPSHVLEVLKLLCLFNPKQLLEIGKRRKKKERIMIDKYWKKFCMQDHIQKLEEERKPNDREISYRSLFEKESRFYRKEAKKVDRSMMLRPDGKLGKKSLKKKIKPPKIPIWKRQISREDQNDMSDDSQCENADYPDDPDAVSDSKELSDSSVDEDLCYHND